MNSKLVKKIAVASLAALISIPNMIIPSNKVLAGGITSSGTIIAGGKQQITSNNNIYTFNNIQSNTNPSGKIKLKDGINIEEARKKENELLIAEHEGKNGVTAKTLQIFYDSLVENIPYRTKETALVVNGLASYQEYCGGGYGFALVNQGFGRTTFGIVDSYLTDVRYIGRFEGFDRYEVDFFAPLNSSRLTHPVYGEFFRNLSGLHTGKEFDTSGGTYIVDYWDKEQIERYRDANGVTLHVDDFQRQHKEYTSVLSFVTPNGTLPGGLGIMKKSDQQD